MTPSDLAQVSAGLASRGSGWGGGGVGGQEGWGAGCACRKVGKKTSTLDSIVPLSVILPLPDLRKIADKQILQEFCPPFFCPLLSGLFAAGSSWMQRAV